MNYSTKRKPVQRFFMPHFGNILNEVMNSSFEDVVGKTPKNYNSPAVNISKNDDNYHIAVALPGFEKKDVDIKIEKDTLIISSSREKEEDSKFRLREFNYGSFERKFALPKNIDQDSIEAKFNNGILTLSLALKPEAKAKTISIK